jgi:hypothetical protein
MLGIHVYFNNGCEIECKDVVNKRGFWRMVSKWCKHTNREPFFMRYTNTPMRVLRVEYTRDTKEREHV